MQIPYISEGKLPLQRHQDCIKAIYECRTAADFDAIPTWIDQYELPAKNRETMDTIIANQRRLLKADTPITDTIVTTNTTTKAEQLAEAYKDIDAENFKIEVAGWTTEPVSVVVTTVPESTPIADPLDAIPQAEPAPIVIETSGPRVLDSSNLSTTQASVVAEDIAGSPEKPKRSRRVKEEGVQSVNNSNNIVLKRRINLPIDGVQYSNNEFGCEVSASTKEEAQALLEEIMNEFMADSGLVRKSSMAEYLKAEFNKWVASVAQQAPVTKEVEKIVYQRTPEDDLEIRRYARVQLFMQALAKDPTILPAMQRIKVEFEKTNPRF